MKVHYESIERTLHRVIDEADRLQRRIDYIELNPREWVEFMTLFPAGEELGIVGFAYCGVQVRKGSFL